MNLRRTLSRARWMILALLGAGFVGVMLLARTATDWLWFDSLGYSELFVRPILWRLGVGVGAFILSLLFLYSNLRFTRESVVQALSRFQDRFPPALGRRWVGRALLVVSAVIAFLNASALAGFWERIAFGIHGGSFGAADPVFARDIGFYVFTLPMWDVLRTLGTSLFALTALLCGAVYVAAGGAEWRGLSIRLETKARVHLSLLVAGLFAFKALDYYLKGFELVYSTRGAIYDAAYTDVHAVLPVLRILTVVAALLAILAIINALRPLMRWLLIGTATLLVLSFGLGGIYPGFIQEFVVRPNELEKELPYVRHHIQMTRQAFGLDGAVTRTIDATDEPTPGVISENPWLHQSVRLWDWRPLIDTFGQIQSLRPYYDFIEVDVDRYWIDGAYRQVMISPRELTSAKLQNQSWVNLHTQYTHGYGVVVSPVNEVSPRGLPNFLVSDIPPRARTYELTVSRPEIYYGEQESDYVIVRTQRPEFDYPRGDENATTFYEGDGGVQLSNYVRKLLFAARFATTRILFSNDITPESRVMFRRQIVERVATLAPFLRLDGDPYIVVADGRLYWMIDAYTTSDRYPYARPLSDWGNYARNAVKVVVDAYHGAVDFYVADPEPVVAALSRVYPGTFKPIDQMPESLRTHVRYPEDLFLAQATVLTRYHMQDPQVFYNQEDVWDLPREIYEQSEIGLQPYYITTRLPGESGEEFVIMLPYTPVGKANMVAWLAARIDGEKYGELLLYSLSKQEIAFGPMQFEAQVNQDTEISSQLTLWGQQGSRVIRGNLIIIPVGTSFMYVEPLFLQAEQGRMPELKRVIVGLGSRIVMRESFADALSALVGEGGVVTTPAPQDPLSAGEASPEVGGTVDMAEVRSLAKRAGDLFDEARRHAAAGAWSEYGQTLAELSETLEALEGSIE